MNMTIAPPTSTPGTRLMVRRVHASTLRTGIAPLNFDQHCRLPSWQHWPKLAERSQRNGESKATKLYSYLKPSFRLPPCPVCFYSRLYSSQGFGEERGRDRMRHFEYVCLPNTSVRCIRTAYVANFTQYWEIFCSATHSSTAVCTCWVVFQTIYCVRNIL